MSTPILYKTMQLWHHIKNNRFRHKLQKRLIEEAFSEPSNALENQKTINSQINQPDLIKMWSVIELEAFTPGPSPLIKRSKQLISLFPRHPFTAASLAIALSLIIYSRGQTSQETVETNMVRFKSAEKQNLKAANLPRISFRFAIIDSRHEIKPGTNGMQVSLAESIMFSTEANGNLPDGGLRVQVQMVDPQGNESIIIADHLLNEKKHIFSDKNGYIVYNPTKIGPYEFKLSVLSHGLSQHSNWKPSYENKFNITAVEN
ncbi:MAG: hypothetical protein R3B45_05585 [Bdellovibrionota bacterium]